MSTIFANDTALLAIVTAPEDARVASPLIAVAVGALLPLPINTCPAVILASLVCAMAALAATSAFSMLDFVARDPKPVTANVIVSFAASVVIAMLAPADRVRVSLVASATTDVFPATAMVPGVLQEAAVLQRQLCRTVLHRQL